MLAFQGTSVGSVWGSTFLASWLREAGAVSSARGASLHCTGASYRNSPFRWGGGFAWARARGGVPVAMPLGVQGIESSPQRNKLVGEHPRGTEGPRGPCPASCGTRPACGGCSGPAGWSLLWMSYPVIQPIVPWGVPFLGGEADRRGQVGSEAARWAGPQV